MKNSLTSLSEAKKLIDEVNLAPTVERLIKVHKWKRNQAVAACQQYRNYLLLKHKYGKTHALPPSFDIDEVWHAHILHTLDYYNFCQQAFGEYLHHHPHHGKDNSITDAELESAFEDQTQKLYHLEFGQYIEAIRPLPLKVIIKRLIEILKSNKKSKDLSTSETESRSI